MKPSPGSIAATPEPPYYAVIFTSQRTAGDRGYGEMAERMTSLARTQPGFLGVESVRNAEGLGITVSYWANEESIIAWKAHCEHQPAQEAGKKTWYADYQLRVAKVERAYGKPEPQSSAHRKLEIKLDALTSPKIIHLLSEHLRSLSEITEPGSMHALDLDRLRKPEITFWSVWNGDDVVGCGAIKELNSQHAEIKSMRTATAYLRKGVAAALLSHIISEARKRGYRRLSLETGAKDHFKPAHALYRKFGFTTCGPFAEYKEDTA